ncbi:hypothetical protein LZZ90_12175 [Flavobacterium sp. SM15]|uniref:hypothetical protein n=1 Tax=Flavobacterium sp. SM15 TaxID=2908005 RepID=UPI001EDA6774|nr:hypothetical protein [Flavobacterium sp. SM15]MCG2612263.1 hypothetical protein [Flavobacterium sp. SM15]
MNNFTSVNPKRFIYGCLALILLSSCKKEVEKEENKKETAAYNKSEGNSCEASWFPHSQTPAPEEGEGSPFDTTSTTNEIFHQWSWQKFLWLTKPEANQKPLFLNKLTQVSDALLPVTPQPGASIVLADTEQAGSNGVLKANPIYGGTNQIAKDFTVYYSIHANEIMIKAAKTYKDSINSGKLSPNNLKTFPVGSLELKVSWVDANTIRADKQKNFYITDAAVSVDGKSFQKKKMALLGMHVVGVVINHPEFIWATFQHNDLAPVYDWKTNQASSTEDKLLYSKGTTTGLDGITWVKNSGPKQPLKAYDLFQFGVPKTSGDQYMKTCQMEPENFDNIKTINECVAGKLDDVWNNYFYNGSIWINTDGMNPQQQAKTIVNLGFNIGNATPGSSARGSLNNANITMETYTQTFEKNISDINASNLANCFSCHNAVSFASGSPKSPLYISHVFDAYLLNSQGKTRVEINNLKDKQHLMRFITKTLK